MTRPLPTHPTLRHPRTGAPMMALGFTGRGQAIWPQMGGSGEEDPPTDPPADPPADPPRPPEGEQLGDAGKRALAEERKARKTAETELARYRKAEQERADADKSELQKASEAAAAAQQRAEAAEARALRLEVAQTKGLPPGLAKRLQGATREELEADADELLAAVPPKAGDPPTKTGPRPDPSQGAKGDPAPPRPRSLGEAVTQALTKR